MGVVQLKTFFLYTNFNDEHISLLSSLFEEYAYLLDGWAGLVGAYLCLVVCSLLSTCVPMRLRIEIENRYLALK